MEEKKRAREAKKQQNDPKKHKSVDIKGVIEKPAL